MTEEVRSALLAGDNRARSDGGSGENKCSNRMTATEDRVSITQPTHYGDRQRIELLCLWRIQVYSSILLEQETKEQGGGREKTGV